MGTSDEIQHQHQHQHTAFHGNHRASMEMHAQHQQQHQQHQQAHLSSHHHASGPFARSASPSAWPQEKLSEADVSVHAAQSDNNNDMEVDPSYDGHEPQRSPSPPHYADNNVNMTGGGSSVFHYGDSTSHQQLQQQQQQQVNYAGLVATPITRFLTKQTFGFIPKPSFPSATDGNSLPSSPVPSSPLLNGDRKVPVLRLPSLLSSTNGSGSSPLNSPHQQHHHQPAFSLPVGETLSRLFGSASLTSNTNSAPGTPTSLSSSSSTLPPRGSTVTLPPLKRACPSPTTTLPSLKLTLEDICKPFRYQRSLSCPSDSMARAVAAEAAYEAYAAPRAAEAAAATMLQYADVPMSRLERSNSMDIGTVLARREAHNRALYGGDQQSSTSFSSSSSCSPATDYQSWLNRTQGNCHPLASLAESAHALQRLEQGQSSSSFSGLDSPRGGISSTSDSGGESTNPFCVSNDDFKREKKLCAFAECASNAVTRGLCISHGGGRRCQRKGCTRGAQSKGLCVAHGGGRICRAKGCSNIQRSMGLCIRHGGGKRCSVSGCQKGVVRQDLCTAHGGKRKCKVEDCNKHVKKKGLCRSHANSVLGAAAMASPDDDVDLSDD